MDFPESAPIDTGVDVERISETLSFLNGKPEDVKDMIKSIIMEDQEISNKIGRIKKLLGDSSLFDDWMKKVTYQEQLEKLNLTQQDWNPEKFHAIVFPISQLTTKEAEQFFNFCRQNVVDKIWPAAYAMDLAKLTLIDDAKTIGQPGNKGDCPRDKFDGHAHSPSIPVAPERIQQPVNLNDNVPGPKVFSPLKIDAAGRELHLKDSLTIVFMGMSGSGKTTMVNGIANSFRYETFDKALKRGPRVVVPTRFTTWIGSKAEIVQPALTINSQSQMNENLNPNGSQSVTKNPMTYEFSYNTTAGKIPVRIVDTPGLNDTEGDDQDKTNLAKTFAFLEKLDKIDLICIVLKGNESRLSYFLNSALKKLLSRLRHSTYKNVSFVFTNGKTPGGSLDLLREYFKDDALNTNKDNWFAFDNEPFRYLCTVRQYPELANGEKEEDCQELYDHNVEELKRLLQRAECHPPFKMSSGPVERKEATLGQTIACHASTPDKIDSGASSINNNRSRGMEQGPSTSVSTKQERSLTRVTAPVPVHHAQIQADKEEDLRRKEKIEYERTCWIVKALAEPLAQQIFDICKQMSLLPDEIIQIQEDIDRLKKESSMSCRSCSGQRCGGRFDGVNGPCTKCYHHREDHENACWNLDKLEEANASFAMKVSAKEELEKEDNVLRSACHHFSFFLTAEHQYSFFDNFVNMMNQLENGLYYQNLDETQRELLSQSIKSFLTEFRRNIENEKQDQTYGELENAKKKLAELQQLKDFGPRVTEIINLPYRML